MWDSYCGMVSVYIYMYFNTCIWMLWIILRRIHLQWLYIYIYNTADNTENTADNTADNTSAMMIYIYIYNTTDNTENTAENRADNTSAMIIYIHIYNFCICVYIHIDIGILIIAKNTELNSLESMCQMIDTGWRRHIGCHIFIGHFPQKSPVISGTFAANDLRLIRW